MNEGNTSFIPYLFIIEFMSFEANLDKKKAEFFEDKSDNVEASSINFSNCSTVNV